MMERKFAKFFHRLVHEIIPDNGQRDKLFEALRRYQSYKKLHPLLVDLRELLDEPQKLELYEFIRPLILLGHQMEYSYLAPAVPGVRLRTIRLRRAPGQSLGFAVRGGYEFSVGVFVSVVEPGSQAEKQGLRVGDEIVRVNGFTIAEAIHDDVLSLIKSREEIVLKVTHIGMLPIKDHASDSVTWRYVEDMDSKKALNEVLAEKHVNRGRGLELKIFIDCTGYESIGCGILSGPPHYPGIFVEKVRPGHLAQEVGLEVGDQIVEVNETSFLNIGHKEAVVVLKGSKQLNIIIRKHAGLPLFERRQTPSRVSGVSSSSSKPARSLSPHVSSQRSPPSVQREIDPAGLDESQLIEQQLGRTGLFRSHASSSSPPADGQFGDQVRISTQAEVHSDSDSIPGSLGEGPRIPFEEPAPADHPATPPSSSPRLVPSLVITDDLGNPRNVPSSPPPPLPPPSPLNLPETLANSGRNTPSPIPTLTLTGDGSYGDDLSQLPLPDDLGDPVLAVLHRSEYPPDSPPWVLPHSHLDPPDVSGIDLGVSDLDSTLTDTNKGEGLQGNSLDLTKGQSSVVSDHVLVVKETHVFRHVSHTEHTNTVSFTLPTLGSTPPVNGWPISKVIVEEEEMVEETGVGSNAEEETGALVNMDTNSNYLSKEDASSESAAELSSVRTEVDAQGASTDSAGKRSSPPVFVPPPPPSSPPPPTTSLPASPSPPPPLDSWPGGQRKASISSQLSTASTQTHKSGMGGEMEGRFFSLTSDTREIFADELEEEGSDVHESFSGEGIVTTESGVVQTGVKNISAEIEQSLPSLADALGLCGSDGGNDRQEEGGEGRDGWEEDDVSLNEGGLSVNVLVDVHHSPLPDYFSEDSKEDGKKSPETSGSGDVGETAEAEKEAEKLDVDGSNFVRSGLSGGEDSVVDHDHDHDLPPPPASFFEDNHDHEKDTDIPSVLPQIHNDTNTQPKERSAANMHDKIPPKPSPSFQSKIFPPARPPVPTPLVLGGAAAFLAVRREAREAARLPRLLVAAEPGFSADAFTHDRLASLFNTLELDGRELKSFVYPKNQSLGIEMEGGMGTPLAGRIVVAAVFDGGAAMEKGLQTGDQLMMINGRKLTDVTVAQAEQILDEVQQGPKELIQVVYAQSSFLNDEECVTYF